MPISFTDLLSMILLIDLFSSKLIGTTIDDLYYSSLCISMKYSSSSQDNKNFLLTLDLNSSITFIVDQKSNINDNVQIIQSDISIPYKSYNLTGTKVCRPIEFIKQPDTPINLLFYQTNTFIPGLQSSLGLNYNYHNKSDSLIHQMKDQGYIDNLSFSFIQDQIQRQFYIGGIPSNYSEEGRNHSSCYVMPGYFNWNCYLSKIMIIKGDTSFSIYVNNRFYFNSASWYILAPTYFIDYLFEYLFKKEFETHQCFTNGVTPNRYLICDFRPSSIQGNISFVFGGHAHSIQWKEFWLCGEDICRFSIKENGNGNEIVLGNAFIHMFNILFDYEESKIHFYAYKGIEKFNEGDTFNEGITNNTNVPKWIYADKIVKGIIVGIIVNLFFGLCVIGVIKRLHYSINTSIMNILPRK